VGTQTGTKTAGVPGTVTFSVTTENIADGVHEIDVENLPTGVTVHEQITITAGKGTKTLSGNASTVAGTTSNLRLTIDGATSAAFTLTVQAATSDFVAVAEITDVPTTATAGTPLTLSGVVHPANATNKTIAWSVQNAGTTNATIAANVLTVPNAGTVTVRATIANGATATTNFTQDFTITVNAGFVAVTGISGVPSTTPAGTPLTLVGTIAPTNATNQTIPFSINN
jgi:endo-1,4-beta-xylanase